MGLLHQDIPVSDKFYQCNSANEKICGMVNCRENDIHISNILSFFSAMPKAVS